MAIQTITGHITQAINFSQQSSLYFELAKQTDWSDPSSPDSEVSSTTDLPDSQAFVSVVNKFLVYDNGVTTKQEDTDTYIIYKGHQWNIATTENAVANKAYYVVLIGNLSVGVLPSFKYTQIGIRQGTVLASNVASQDYAKASDVTTKGSLLYYENRQLETYTDATRKNIKYMIKF